MLCVHRDGGLHRSLTHGRPPGVPLGGSSLHHRTRRQGHSLTHSGMMLPAIVDTQ